VRPGKAFTALAVALALAAALALTAPLLGGCGKSQAHDFGASAHEAISMDGREIVSGACLSCHSDAMLSQQRLTEAQWKKVVTNMVGWGASLEPAQVGPVVTYLSATYGPDAGSVELTTVRASDALAELAPTDDGPLPVGDPTRGGALFIDKCSGCHGQDARGHLGTTLIDRPFLYRSADFARIVRVGRGKMPPTRMSDAAMGDLLAHLRPLRNAPP
jgi:mono/diheme cytochrome c family protein